MPTIASCYTLDWSPDWAALFGAERPLIVEIGFGSGDYLVALAESYPDHNIIGFEISNKSLVKAEKKTRHHDHVRVVHSRGETALHHLLTPQSVAQFHINYPDPWFKTRHAGRRIMQRDTLDAIVNRLTIGGMFYLATDIVDYARMSADLLAQTPHLDNQLDAAWVNQLPQRLTTTKYEQRGMAQGRPGNYFVYRRNAQPAPDIPVLKELPVPHAIIKTPLTPQAMLEKFTGRIENEGRDDIHAALTHLFIDYRLHALLLEVHIIEPTIEQHVAMMLSPRDEAQTYTLKHTTIGYPRMTLGLHRATGFVADWLATLHPDAEVLMRQYQT